MRTCVLIGMILGGVLTGCSKKNTSETTAIPVRCAKACSLDFDSSSQSYIAMVKCDTETELGFKVGGILETIGPAAGRDWREGMSVQSNQVLARLIQSDFISASNSAQARWELEGKLFTRNTNLFQTKVISSNELDIITARLKESQANFEQAKQALRDTELRAPYTGKILSRLAEVGETIQPGKSVLRIGDLSQMSLEFGVPDKLISQIKPNDAKKVTISALEGQWQSFTGRVSEVGVAAREGARLFKVVLKVPNPDEKLKSGMTATVHLETGLQKKTNVVVVPLSALVASSSGDSKTLAVFVIKPDTSMAPVDQTSFRGTVKEKKIIPDDIIGNSIMVTEGLTTNDWVVVAGLNSIYEGASVLATPQP